jgi:UDP-glucose 4-epimerase
MNTRPLHLLLTGGAGYIGSHAAVLFQQAGHQVFIYDNFCNSDPAVCETLEKITGQSFKTIQGDIRDTALLQETLETHRIDAVIHFAGLKAVGESGKIPVDYYANNVQGTISVLQAMQAASHRPTTLVFSSSATVYGDPQYLPIDESHPTGATNPYGRTKLHIEEILGDLARADSSWRIACLRYFNPVGAHPSGLIGENPNGIPNNLLPFVAQVAVGKLKQLNVFGNDYDTPDGTGVRDYIHVMDLVEGHLAALNYLFRSDHDIYKHTGLHTFNLGTGRGNSVFEMVKAFESASGQSIPFHIDPRRLGDIASCYASTELAAQKLGWQATRDLKAMCESSWHFQQKNVDNTGAEITPNANSGKSS